MHSRCTQLCIHSRRMSEAFRTYAFPLFPNSGNGKGSIYKFPFSTACESRHNCFSAPVMIVWGN